MANGQFDTYVDVNGWLSSYGVSDAATWFDRIFLDDPALGAEGSATLTMTGSGTATVDIASAGAATLTMVGTGTATLDIEAVGSAVFDLVGSGTATIDLEATGAALLEMAGSGTTTVDLTASGAATLTMTASGTMTIVVADPIGGMEDAIHAWVVAGSGLDADHVIWADARGGGPQPAGPYISLRIIDVDSVSDDWLISRREAGGVAHHVRGTRHPTLEITSFAGSSYGAQRAEIVLARVQAAVRLPTVAAALRVGDVGVGTFERVRVVEGRRSGMFDPRAVMLVQLHIKIDVSELGGEFLTVDVTTPGPVVQVVEEP